MTTKSSSDQHFTNIISNFLCKYVQAEQILRATLKEEKSVDRWTAAQCLAYYGECDSEVVGELVYHLLHTEDSIRHEQASNLLTRLSENSVSITTVISHLLCDYLLCHCLLSIE